MTVPHRQSSIVTPITPADAATKVQHRASNPGGSFWVGASAGTGKTKVLIERVLRLLLPRDDGRPGTMPDHILCLTFTRAAAAEMTERLIKRLSEWVILPDDKLRASIADVLGTDPTQEQMIAGRRLFSRIVDGPAQVRMMTIHAFCLSVLSRFPVEAGVQPNFTPIEDAEIDVLLQEARRNVLTRKQDDDSIRTATEKVTAELSDDTLTHLISTLFKERRLLISILRHHPRENWAADYARALGVPDDMTPDTWAQQLMQPDNRFESGLRALCAALAESTKTDQGLAVSLQNWLDLHGAALITGFHHLETAFFTKGGEPRANGQQGVRKTNAQLADDYARLQNVVAALRNTRQAFDVMAANENLLLVATAILHEYNLLKARRGALDFDDLVGHTLDLLRRGVDGTLSWIMFKLDGGIDHILLDESQDTNPEQWDIVKLLAQEFFTGRSESDEAKTIFVVGDIKQSIYSFQRADPQIYRASLAEISSRAAESEAGINEVALDVSFRSTAPVLTLVDQVFAPPTCYHPLGATEPPIHVISRVGQAGAVTLWPLMADEDGPVRAPWDLPIVVRDRTDAKAILAAKIARQIRTWLDTGEMLPARRRSIRPGDIMILLRSRDPFLPLLLAALRGQNVPVGGPDRMVMTDALAVQDLLVAARFAVSPHDDLALATLLKTPLLGCDDDDLLALAPARKGTLWAAVQAHPDYRAVADYLTGLIDRAQSGQIYRFFVDLVHGPCPADVRSGCRAMMARLSGDVADVIHEFMHYALLDDGRADGMLGFVTDLTRDAPELKRDVTGDEDVVRIMTVHASKGLEAPIVILPDTMRTGAANNKPRIFWPGQTGCGLPIWVPRKDERPDVLNTVLDRVKDAEAQESARLLYVALTRAQDRLIIAGAGAERENANPTWYDMVRDGFRRLEHLPGFVRTMDRDGDILHFETAQTVDPDRVKDNVTQTEMVSLDAVRVDAALTPLPADPAPVRPLRAERPSGHDVAPSPLLSVDDPHRFLRGTITHKLLQVLPNVPTASREGAARAYLARMGADMDEATRNEVVREVLAILDHPDFAPIFGVGSWAEVPVTGMVDGTRLISGQIDRLLVTDTEILIIDYKTNRPPPAAVETVPDEYVRQLRAYRDVLAAIYPGRRVRCALLWTDGPRLMVLDSLSIGG